MRLLLHLVLKLAQCTASLIVSGYLATHTQTHMYTFVAIVSCIGGTVVTVVTCAL